MLIFTRILADLALMGVGKAIGNSGKYDRYQRHLEHKAARAKVEEKWRREREEEKAKSRECHRLLEESIKREQAERAERERREAETQRNNE